MTPVTVRVNRGVRGELRDNISKRVVHQDANDISFSKAVDMRRSKEGGGEGEPGERRWRRGRLYKKE